MANAAYSPTHCSTLAIVIVAGLLLPRLLDALGSVQTVICSPPAGTVLSDCKMEGLSLSKWGSVT